MKTLLTIALLTIASYSSLAQVEYKDSWPGTTLYFQNQINAEPGIFFPIKKEENGSYTVQGGPFIANMQDNGTYLNIMRGISRTYMHINPEGVIDSVVVDGETFDDGLKKCVKMRNIITIKDGARASIQKIISDKESIPYTLPRSIALEPYQNIFDQVKALRNK